jgi:predicted type IV restriction endonuclease
MTKPKLETLIEELTARYREQSSRFRTKACAIPEGEDELAIRRMIRAEQLETAACDLQRCLVLTESRTVRQEQR